MEDENRSIFQIMDGIIEQVNKTRTVFTILIALLTVLLTALALVYIVFDIDEMYYYEEGEYLDEMSYYEGQDLEEVIFYDILFFDVIPSLAIIIVMVFAVRQLIILKRWTKKYEQFKSKQRELEEKTDEELEKD